MDASSKISMSNLATKAQAFINEHNLINEGSTIIIGLSGGPDSVALLSVLKKLQPQYNLQLIAAHLDHQWRTDSAQDVTFCKNLADKLDVTFITAKAEDINLPPLKRKKASGSQEELGRLLRRSFFEGLAEHNAIALGHHYNDQQETFFLRMIRGASIAGLAAMKPRQGIYIRPLLDCTKQELLDYLTAENLNYLEDETNKDPKYLRNAIRHQVIPVLKDCDARFDASFHRTLKNIQSTDAYIERITQDTFSTITTQSQDTLHLNKEQFLATDPFLHHRLLVTWLCKEQVPFTPTTAFFNEIMRFMNNQGKEHKVHTSWKLVKQAGMISIEKTP